VLASQRTLTSKVGGLILEMQCDGLLHTVSSAAFDTKSAGNGAAEELLMKTYARLVMDSA
jgi:hypothetical protein